jgi:hypothetical protein
MPDKQALEYEQVVYVPVSSLVHDPENPRLPPKFKGKLHDEADIIDWLIRDAKLLELIGAISQVGYFPGEPLLVTPCEPGKIEGPYFVVEGNRRFTAVLLLLFPDKAPIYKELIERLSQDARNKDKLQSLPVLIYEERREILDYLGYRHITGVKDWGTFEKAEYLTQLSLTSPYKEMVVGPQHSALARTIGSRADYVALLLTARALFQQAQHDNLLVDLDVDRLQSDFSLLTTALTYENIAKYISLDPRDVSLNGLSNNEFKQLLDWLYKPTEPLEPDKPGKRPTKSVVGESRNIKKLSRIVDNQRATTYLIETKDLDGAEQKAFFKRPADGFNAQLNNINNSIKSALEMLAEVTDDLNDEHAHNAKDIEDKSTELYTSVRKIVRALKDKE